MLQMTIFSGFWGLKMLPTHGISRVEGCGYAAWE